MGCVEWFVLGMVAGGGVGAGLVAWGPVLLSAFLSMDASSTEQRAAEVSTTVDEVFAVAEPPDSVIWTLSKEHEEVQALYENTGHSPRLEQKARQLLRALRGTVTVEIPDYDAFRDAVEEAREAMARLSDREAVADAQSQADMEEAEALLNDVWAHRDDPNSVRQTLEEAPIARQLPYVERVPVMRDGRVHWRSPARVSVLRKRPADPEKFRRLLSQFSRLVKTTNLSRPTDLIEDVRTVIGRLRHTGDDADTYVPTLLNRLEEATGRWLDAAPRPKWRARKEQLDACMLDLHRLAAARSFVIEVETPPRRPTREAARERYQDIVMSRTEEYLDTPWMQCHWLTDQLLAHLLTVEVSKASGTARKRLSTVENEVRTRRYDPAESIRRLRQHEETSGFVQSLVFALLRHRQERSPSSVS